MDPDSVKQRILELVGSYHAETWPEKPFIPGETRIPVSGRVFDANDLIMLVESSLDFWLTTGRFADEFEREFAKFLHVRNAILCNSGSSANLLAISALTSPKLKARALHPGDEVVTVAAGFPTTVNPIFQLGLRPVFVDIDLGTYNVNITKLEEAITKKTKAIFLAHTLGNPFNLNAVRQIAQDYRLWLIEDNCDALGSLYDGRFTGSFGDLATVSFYPAHHITMGEGGCVLTHSPLLKTLVESFRDWGRDCWCDPGMENTCGKRYGWKLGDLPDGYDHKYIYSHIGYNLKLTDMQAAVGVSQLKKLPGFIRARRENWDFLKSNLAQLEDFFILPEPTENSIPSWFGFLLTLRPELKITRKELLEYLYNKKIDTRLLFGGNISKQPAYKGKDFRIYGDLSNSDIAMERSFWIGVFPGLTKPMLEYVLENLYSYCDRL
jgi:CDP-6-deoxy-D-xylo-4-hexulose-3-dehydrase